MGILRRATEIVLPLGANEEHLSERARKAVFVGSYIRPSSIVYVSADEIPLDERDARAERNPYVLTPVRWSVMAGERASSMSMTDDKPFMDVAAEMSDPKKIRRANHVESFDRGLKMATSIALMVAAITIGANLSESDAVSATIPVCGDVVDGAELLVPVSYESTQDMQSAGIAVCVGRP